MKAGKFEAVFTGSTVVCCLLFVVCCLLFVACCLLFVVCCLLFVVCCLLFVVCCLLFVVCGSSKLLFVAVRSCCLWQFEVVVCSSSKLLMQFLFRIPCFRLFIQNMKQRYDSKRPFFRRCHKIGPSLEAMIFRSDELYVCGDGDTSCNRTLRQ
jgi:hypothetical protein